MIKSEATLVVNRTRRDLRSAFLLLVFTLCSCWTFGQYTVSQCQTATDALIAPDRNDWSHANLPIVNEGYLHNFNPPILPCGLETATLLSVEVSINLESITGIGGCTNLPIFGNVLLNCPLTPTSICPIVQDVLSPGCAFGAGQSNIGTYFLLLNSCGVTAQATDVIGVDIIPATELMGTCPTVDDAISSGNITIEYTICITYTYNQDQPTDCENTVVLACDDGDPCTENDQITVDACDADVVCLPCAGALSASCDDTVQLPCDDADPCTVNDMLTVSACDNALICEPCMGEPESDCTSTIDLPCDDGDPCTDNDVEGVSACDNSLVCIPCQGSPVPQCTSTISLPCDDGDDCTVDDVEVVDACDNSIVCVPCDGLLSTSCDDTLILPCDDGDPCTINDVQTVSVCDNTFVCEPCLGEFLADCNATVDLPCDDGDPCTGPDFITVSACDEELICVPCQGAALASCSNILTLPCDDGDPCTENDVELLDACDTSIICQPCQGDVVVPQLCDDGDCDNGVEIWDESSCSCVTVPAISGCTDVTSCNYNALANCDVGCDYSCLDCLGVPFGEATLDACGECLLPGDDLRDISCLDIVYLPNAFTPDGDGVNDYFSLRTALELAYFELRIFDRFGQEVYYSTDPEFKWTGDIKGGDYYGMSQLYVYRIQYSFKLPEVIQKTGTVSLFR